MSKKEETDAVSVGELIERLLGFSEETPVMALYDCGTAGGSVIGVKTGPSPDDNSEWVVLVVD